MGAANQKEPTTTDRIDDEPVTVEQEATSVKISKPMIDIIMNREIIAVPLEDVTYRRLISDFLLRLDPDFRDYESLIGSLLMYINIYCPEDSSLKDFFVNRRKEKDYYLIHDLGGLDLEDSKRLSDLWVAHRLTSFISKEEMII